MKPREFWLTNVCGSDSGIYSVNPNMPWAIHVREVMNEYPCTVKSIDEFEALEAKLDRVTQALDAAKACMRRYPAHTEEIKEIEAIESGEESK